MILRKTAAIALALLISLSAALPAFAEDTTENVLESGGGIAARLEHIQNESGYTVGTAEYNCYTFAKRVFFKLFEVSDANINYHGDYDPATYSTQLIGRLYTPMRCTIISCGGKDPTSASAQALTLGTVTAANVATLLSMAKTGDILQGHRGDGVHTMIVDHVIYDSDGNVTGVDVYHGNWNSKISRNTFTCEQLANTYDHAFSVYHAKNYELMDIGASVYFESCGGSSSYSSMFVNGGTEIGELPTATRLGYTFDGWYTSESGGTAADPTTVPTTFELTYYAHWTPIEYNISFDSCGGDDVAAITAQYGSGYGTLPDAGERAGYTFAGWYTAPGDIGESVTSETTVNIAADHTLYAHWQKEQYTVTLDAMGGVCDEEQITVTYGEPYGSLPVPTKEGYIFTGWATDEHGLNRRSSSMPVTKTADHTLYAMWEENITGSPQNLSCTASGKAAALSWQVLDGADGYQIYRREAGESYFKRIATLNSDIACNFSDGSRESGIVYEYRIRAFKTVNKATVYGEWSDTVSG